MEITFGDCLFDLVWYRVNLRSLITTRVRSGFFIINALVRTKK